MQHAAFMNGLVKHEKVIKTHQINTPLLQKSWLYITRIMGFSWVDTMKLDFTTTKSLDEKLNVSDVKIRFASTIFSDGTLQNAAFIKEGNFMLSMSIEREDAEKIISALNQHIANIKENELELIALNTKAAA